MAFSHRLLIHHGRPCPYCGVTMRVPPRSAKGKARGGRCNRPDFPTRDHVIPRSRMPGMGTLIVCRRCNEDKQDLTILEWHVALKAAEDPRAPLVKAWMDANRATMLRLRQSVKPTGPIEVIPPCPSEPQLS